MAEGDEQSQPVLDEGRSARSAASRDDKVQGILDQTRADVALTPDVDALRLLTVRLADAHIEMDEDEIAALAVTLK